MIHAKFNDCNSLYHPTNRVKCKNTLKNWFKLCKIRLILSKHPVYKNDIS